MNVYIKKPFGPAQGRQNLAWQKVAVSAAILFALIIFLNTFQKQVKNSFFYVSAPISKIFLRAGKNTADFFGSFSNFPALKKENVVLKTENQSLLASLSSLQEAIKSNQDLRGALENTKNDAFTLLEAKITGLDIQNDTILIDKGSQNGVIENMPVISAEKILFGKITKVYPNFSQIMLISNKKSTLAVKIQDADPVKSPVYGAIKGSGNLSIYMDLINTDSAISPGDVLVTSGQEGIFPKDLLVGKVQALNTGDAKAFQSATVQPFFDPKNSDNIFIITNYLKK